MPLFSRAIALFALFAAACSSANGPVLEPATAPGAGAAGGAASSASPGSSETFGGQDDTAADAGRPARCDDAGDCSCIRIASIGHEGVWGPCSSDSTTALQNWLNTQSTAKVDDYDVTKPTLTPAFLAQYDVILLQWMVQDGKQNDDGPPWTFSSEEVAALKAWVQGGGGLIALSGYQCNGAGCTIADVTATNQLLSFTDIQFDADDAFDPANASCPDCYCWGGSLPVGAAVDGGSTATGAWSTSSPIGAHLSDVGAYIARTIRSTTASVDSTDGTHAYAVHEDVGQGHVFAYGDEWVTYSGEWLGTASCLDPSMYTNASDPCYERSAAQVFQIPQFWYNAIKYAAASVQCFDVQSPVVIK